MGGGHDGADAGFSARDGGEADAGGPQACLKERGGKLVRSLGFADEDGGDGGLAGPDVEALFAERVLVVARVVPELGDALRLLFEEVEGGEAGGGDGRGWEVENRKGRARR